MQRMLANCDLIDSQEEQVKESKNENASLELHNMSRDRKLIQTSYHKRHPTWEVPMSQWSG